MKPHRFLNTILIVSPTFACSVGPKYPREGSAGCNRTCRPCQCQAAEVANPTQESPGSSSREYRQLQALVGPNLREIRSLRPCRAIRRFPPNILFPSKYFLQHDKCPILLLLQREGLHDSHAR